METVTIDPNNIRYENGEMVAVWPTFLISEALHSFGEKLRYEEKAAIPASFAPVVQEAKERGRYLRITYLGILGPQTAFDVRMV